MLTNQRINQKKKKALIIGAHPDDPKTGCGGTILMLRKAGWDVVSAYMTKGEGGIVGKSHDEAAAIRSQEAREACKVLDCRPVLMTQIDGNSEVNKERYAEMMDLIATEKPDIVFTHWPLDSHADHRVCSILVYNAWRRLDYSFELYYFEVMSVTQSTVLGVATLTYLPYCIFNIASPLLSLFFAWTEWKIKRLKN